MSMENFTALVHKYDDRIGETLFDEDGESYIFNGIMWAEDDFYYMLLDEDSVYHHVSCVVNLDQAGYEFASDIIEEETDEEDQHYY